MTRQPLREILKANDLRGLVPAQWGTREAIAIGAALAEHLGPKPILVGRDMRRSGADLSNAIARGVTSCGVDVVDLGLVSTDACYFASGTRNLPGVVLTASHNPGNYNGMKVMRSGASPVGRDNGLSAIVRRAQAILDRGGPTRRAVRGHVTGLDILPDYATYLRRLVDLSDIRPIKVAVDAGNGMAGQTIPAVFGSAVGMPPLPVEIIPLYFKLDGTFPNHPANPLDPANTRDLSAAIIEHGADLGFAFDGDAARCFVLDERGEVVGPSVIAAIVGLGEIERDRQAERKPVLIHNLITSRALPELVARAGATPVKTKVGHVFVKQEMAERDAAFGAEHSAHYYFRDFFYADTAVLAAMHVIAAKDKAALPMSALAEAYEPYAASGEINEQVASVEEAIAAVRAAFEPDAARGALAFDTLDGLTVDHWSASPRWWANVRPSNTEPLLRINVEAADADVMAKVRDEILAILSEREPKE